MAGRSTAVSNGHELRDAVAAVCRALGLDVATEVEVGRRIWGSRRKIDVIVTSPETRERLGIECKYQATPGTAQEKIPATINDIASWPIRGLVVFAGDGFTDNMQAFLLSTGKAVHLRDVEIWVRLYFGLPLNR